MGLQSPNESRVYPFSELAKGNGILKDQFDGQDITIEYNAAHRSARVKNKSVELIPSLTGFWFAWMAFHPESRVYRYSGK